MDLLQGLREQKDARREARTRCVEYVALSAVAAAARRAVRGEKPPSTNVEVAGAGLEPATSRL